jgi:hypothetical protein
MTLWIVSMPFTFIPIKKLHCEISMTKIELHDVLTYKDMMKTAENMTN